MWVIPFHIDYLYLSSSSLVVLVSDLIFLICYMLRIERDKLATLVNYLASEQAHLYHLISCFVMVNP